LLPFYLIKRIKFCININNYALNLILTNLINFKLLVDNMNINSYTTNDMKNHSYSLEVYL